MTIGAAGQLISPAARTFTLTMTPNQAPLSIISASITLSAVAGGLSPAVVPLTQGRSTQRTNGAWNVVAAPSASITAGTTDWMAMLGTTSGKEAFRDRARGPCTSDDSSQTNLTALPAVWTSGPAYPGCPISSSGR